MAKPPVAKRMLMCAAQNQTIRKSAGAEFELSTSEIKTCVSVVLRDKKGNISLTHIDTTADLDFIKREASEFMQGEFTIDVCAVPNYSHFPAMVLQYVRENFPDVKNSKGTHDLRKMKPSEDQKPLNLLLDSKQPLASWLKQPTSEQIDRSFRCLFAPKYQTKQHEQFVRQFFSKIDKMMPAVAVAGDGRPMDYPSVLNHPTIVEFLKLAKGDIDRKDDVALTTRCRDLAKTQANTEIFADIVIEQNYAQLFPKILKTYFAILEKAQQAHPRSPKGAKAAKPVVAPPSKDQQNA